MGSAAKSLVDKPVNAVMGTAQPLFDDIARRGKQPGMAPAPAIPDITDAAVLAARRAAMRQIGAKQGLQSTFLGSPPVAAPTLLGG